MGRTLARPRPTGGGDGSSELRLGGGLVVGPLDPARHVVHPPALGVGRQLALRALTVPAPGAQRLRLVRSAKAWRPNRLRFHTSYRQVPTSRRPALAGQELRQPLLTDLGRPAQSGVARL